MRLSVRVLVSDIEARTELVSSQRVRDWHSASKLGKITFQCCWSLLRKSNDPLLGIGFCDKLPLMELRHLRSYGVFEDGACGEWLAVRKDNLCLINIKYRPQIKS